MKKIKISNIKLKEYFKLLDEIEDKRWSEIEKLEERMRDESGEKDIGFHLSSYGNGIGTPCCPEKMDLVLREDILD